MRRIQEVDSLDEDEWTNLSQSARSLIVRNYSWDKVAGDYASVFEKMN